MPWTIPDHEKSAIDATKLGLITADLAVLAEVPEPFQSNQHQARVSAISVLHALGGPAARVSIPWTPALYDWTPTTPPVEPPPVDPPIEPPIVVPPPGYANTVVIPAGVHKRYSIKPNADTLYLGEDGAVLDGEDATTYAFNGAANNVGFMNLEIKNYTNAVQRGAIDTPGAVAWRIQNCNIHDNFGAGVALDGDDHVILNNEIHHNHQIGIKVRDGSGSLVEGNEISYNNWLKENKWGWEAGGTKFARNKKLTVRNNHSHNNHGPGLWADIRNSDVLIEGNIVEDNYAAGIFYEINGDGIIRNNSVKRNGAGHRGWLWGAGIQIANSGFVRVYGNTLEGNKNGIAFTDQARGRVSGVVHDNVVVDSGKTGVATNQGRWPAGPFDFHDNQYTGGSFQWKGNALNLAGWQLVFPNDG